MYQDEIIAEVWRNRDAYAARHHHSLAEMVSDLRARQGRPDCKLVDRRDQVRHAHPSTPDARLSDAQPAE
ncbi:hypothetical protein [uncultured Thiodictyon sp.]|uniref:hypothetical protein n=1 Tax=uncultured Thiodictyon sp. TaxID=1846217 RepID=UPI0025F1A6E3|nr:hypothetical protein [uncultured Thiodictyon sp.]